MSFLGINNGSPTLVFANIVTFDKRQCLLYATKYHKSIIIHGMTRIAPKRVTNFLNPRAPRNSFSTFNFNPLPHHRIMNEMDDPGLFRTSSDSTDLRTESMDSAMSHPSVSKACGAGGDIWWSNISYSVGTAQILTNCWGHVPSGKVCAILGPSGAGKSSLMNGLAGRCVISKFNEVSGTVMVGTKKIDPVKYRKHMAYVMQDDALMATATPREALMFSATMRLPPTTPKTKLKTLVDKLLTDLGLLVCADVFIGGPLIKGISGGQRKRTSVGVEVITDPTLLLLDEPTTGLDSHSASNLVKLLKSIAGRNNSAILCTIHQPSSEVFALFDNVIFMKAGRIFYQGPVSAINTYFGDRGHKCPENYNPADFVMNLSQALSGYELEKLFISNPCAPHCSEQQLVHTGAHAVMTYDIEAPESTASADPHHFVCGAPFSTQVAQLMHRELISYYRDPFPLLMRYAIATGLSILFGLVFLGAGGRDNGDDKDFNAHVGLAANCMFSTMLGSSQSLLLVFAFERPVFMREYSSGTYSTAAYMLSKVCLEIPLTLLEVSILFMFAKLMSDLQGDNFQLVAVAFGLAMTSNSIAMIQGAIFPDVKEATSASILLFLPQIFYSGFFTRLNQIPQFIRWPQYLCALSYANKLMFLVEFDSGLKSCNTSPAAQQNCHNIVTANGQDPDFFWVNIACLFALFVCARFVAGVILTFKARTFA